MCAWHVQNAVLQTSSLQIAPWLVIVFTQVALFREIHRPNPANYSVDIDSWVLSHYALLVAVFCEIG
jgi:hypothetical protein